MARKSIMKSIGSQPGRRDVPHDIATWRRALLLESGFDLVLAAELSRDGRIDLHELLKLVDRGCPPPLAARILAPL
jgi:hypothetical protein